MANSPPSPTSILTSLARHQSHLQGHIQSLLDAQSAGLLSGLGHSHDAPSEGSHTPTSSTRSPSLSTSKRTPITSPTRQQHHLSPSRPRSAAPKPPTLSSARRGLSLAIADLAVLKSQESSILHDQLSTAHSSRTLIDNLVRKQDGLRESINTISSQDASPRLRHEEKILSTEIQELEDRLLQMRKRQRDLRREIDALESAVGAKSSSYQQALRMVEKEAAVWLARPPMGLEAKDGMWALPRERRTLSMAQEWLGAEEETWRGRAEGVEKEREALEEGADVWKEVRDVVGGVERALRETMKAGAEEGGMRRVLSSMEAAKEEIEMKLRVAETKGWRLLVCCVGAELEALIEGMEVLKGALDIEGHVPIEEDLLGDTNGLDELRVAAADEDDGPGPDLLIAHQEDE